MIKVGTYNYLDCNVIDGDAQRIDLDFWYLNMDRLWTLHEKSDSTFPSTMQAYRIELLP